ncbi:hypothetical protein F2P79_002152 [Pimephales promelas]|nr:hypothetical protein F2P79_002152 [Pimephales promelas]
MDRGKQTLRQKRTKTKINIFPDAESSTSATNFYMTECCMLLEKRGGHGRAYVIINIGDQQGFSNGQKNTPFVVEQDLQGKMMAAFVLGILLKYKDLKCLQTGVSTEDEEPRAASWKWCHG